MLKAVKIQVAEYKSAKALSKKTGRSLQHILSEAVRQYVSAEQSKESQAA